MDLKIVIEKGSDQRVFICSDSHYFHTNMCRGTSLWRTSDGLVPIDNTRDFKTLEEMNRTIIDNINNVVGQDDILIHGGDFSFGGFENIPKFRNQIYCKTIHHVLGNHDDHIKKNKNNYQDLFTSVSDIILLDFNYKGDKSRLIIQHYPIQSWRDLNQGTIHLHGHSHLVGDRRFGRGRRMDIGFDGSPQFRPYELYSECVVPLRLREIKSDMPFDHHEEEFTKSRK